MYNSLHSFRVSKEMQDARNRLMLRENMICQYCGKLIHKKYDAIAHHIEELTMLNVNLPIALDLNNLMLVHRRCHDEIHERFGFYTQHRYLVYGNPLSGKTTYVNKATGTVLYEEETGNAFSKWNFNPWTTIGVMIGGDTFNNYADDPNPDYYHPSLPEGSYREADVDYYAENRGTKRLVYADECVIYWTADHYETFTLLEF